MIEKQYGIQNISVTGIKPLCSGFLKVAKIFFSHALFNGSVVSVRREVFMRGNSAGVLLYDKSKDVVVLIEQLRVGALAAGLNPWIIEIVGGMVNKGETPEEAAIRESFEETGCCVESIYSVAKYLPNAVCSSEVFSLFCGIVNSDKVETYCGVDGEDIKVRVVPFVDAYAAISSGDICDSGTIIALQWLEKRRGESWLEATF